LIYSFYLLFAVRSLFQDEPRILTISWNRTNMVIKCPMLLRSIKPQLFKSCALVLQYTFPSRFVLLNWWKNEQNFGFSCESESTRRRLTSDNSRTVKDIPIQRIYSLSFCGVVLSGKTHRIEIPNAWWISLVGISPILHSVLTLHLNHHSHELPKWRIDSAKDQFIWIKVTKFGLMLFSNTEFWKTIKWIHLITTANDLCHCSAANGVCEKMHFDFHDPEDRGALKVLDTVITTITLYMSYPVSDRMTAEER
jgi:hypothetical protein